MVLRVKWLLTLVISIAAVSVRADVIFTVGPSGQYATVQAAVDAVPANNTVRHVIEIAPGTYQQRVLIPDNKPFITLRGQGSSPADTKLTFYETASTPPNESTVHASTVVRGKDFVAENLTFENSAGQNAGQALAIYVRGDRAIFNNCRFLGWQDTLRSESGRHYFYNSYVEGSVDFIYGKGTAYFENTTLYAKSAGYLTAQAREGAADTNGYVFKDSTITGSAPDASVYLGRPWQAYSRSIFIDTKMGPLINEAGWSQWVGTSNHLTAYYAEYNSTDLVGNPLDLSNRVSWSHQLTSEDLAIYSKDVWLAGSDGWNPIIAVEPDPSADFDGDGDVDGQDFLVWQRGDSPNAGSAEDLALWQAQYGNPGPLSASVAVPEPANMAFALSLLMLTVLRR
jgi:pectinesterase